MDTRLRVILLIAMIFYFVILTFYVKRKNLNLRYFLIWLFFGFLLVLLLIFPGILTILTRAFGIKYEVNTLLASICFFMILVEIFICSIASETNNKVKRVIQQLALQEKRIRELEEELRKKGE